jgi:hypothetical protein
MKTSMKLIIATMTAAVLASPVMANSLRHAHGRAVPAATVVTDETHGSTAPTRQGRFNTPFSEDCIHVAFPQCTGGN